jgi:hypothetical protein
VLGLSRLITLLLLVSWSGNPTYAQVAMERSPENLLQLADQARRSLRGAEALELAQQGVAMLEGGALGEAGHLPLALHTLGNVLVELGRPLEAIDQQKRALALGETVKASEEQMSLDSRPSHKRKYSDRACADCSEAKRPR